MDIAKFREIAAQAKDAYDQAVTARSVSQRDLTSLLERKHSWTDADISNFTQLVRSDHNLNHAVTSSKEALKKAEFAVDKAFTALLKSILHRYHEEQVWSDKIRSVSTYGSLIVLIINLIVFLGAIAIVEPWKRRRLVRGLEERVKGMVEDVEHTVTGEFEEVKSNMASVAATLATLQAMAEDGKASEVRQQNPFTKTSHFGADPEHPFTSSEVSLGTLSSASPSGHDSFERWPIQNASALLPASTIHLINKVSPAVAAFVTEQDPHRIDMAIVGVVGLITGTAITAVIQAMR
jgi:hypothetical protein